MVRITGARCGTERSRAACLVSVRNLLVCSSRLTRTAGVTGVRPPVSADKLALSNVSGRNGAFPAVAANPVSSASSRGIATGPQ